MATYNGYQLPEMREDGKCSTCGERPAVVNNVFCLQCGREFWKDKRLPGPPVEKPQRLPKKKMSLPAKDCHGRLYHHRGVGHSPGGMWDNAVKAMER